MLVSRISPAPRSTASRAQATASRPVGVRPPATYASQPACPALGVDREHDALGAELGRQLVEQLRARERRRVDRDLVGAGVEHRLGVGDRADPAADRERDEDVVGGAPGQVDDRLALVRGGGDVEEHELVGAVGVVAAASSTGSPASRRSTKPVPLTTRPPSTSRQGITRL